MEQRRRRGEGKPDLLTAEETVIVTSTYGGEERNRTEKLTVRKFIVAPA